jgi:hypothetical protein
VEYFPETLHIIPLAGNLKLESVLPVFSFSSRGGVEGEGERLAEVLLAVLDTLG